MTDYLKIREIVEKIGRDSGHAVDFLQNSHAVTELVHNDDKLDLVGALLDRLGFRRIDSKFRLGKRALVFHTIDGQLVRISYREPKGGRLKLDEILQPILAFDNVAGFRVEVMPEVRTTGLTTEHKRQLIAALAKKGYMFWDCTLENIGLLKDGTPVVIDGDAVIHESKMHDLMTDGISPDKINPAYDHASYVELFCFMKDFIHESVFDLSAFLEEDKTKLEAQYNAYKKMEIPPYDFAASQKMQMEEMGLTRGHIKNVYSQRQLLDLKRHDLDSIIRVAVEELGLYPKELSRVIVQAVHEIDSGKVTKENLSNRILFLAQHMELVENCEIPAKTEALITDAIKNVQAGIKR